MVRAEDPGTGRSAGKVAHPLTIVADEAEATRLAAIGDVVHGWPFKVVAPAVAGSGAALTLRTTWKANGRPAEAPEIRLFNEQLHIVAGSAVARVEDLRGRTVSFGPEGGRSQEAARKAFRALGIAVTEAPLELENALDGVATGDVAAVVVLTASPMPRLRALSQSGLHLLSWPNGGMLPAGAVASKIAADAYPNLAGDGGAVSAMSVEAVLALSAHGAALPAAKRFMEAIAQHAPVLSKRGFELMVASETRRGDHLASVTDR